MSQTDQQQEIVNVLVLSTWGGEFAVLARKGKTDPWVQVATDNEEDAKEYAEELAEDDEYRSDQIRSALNLIWGELDRPIESPK